MGLREGTDVRDEEVTSAPCARIKSPRLFIRCGRETRPLQQVLRGWTEDPGVKCAKVNLGKGPELFLIKQRKQEIRPVDTKPDGLRAGCQK